MAYLKNVGTPSQALDSFVKGVGNVSGKFTKLCPKGVNKHIVCVHNHIEVLVANIFYEMDTHFLGNFYSHFSNPGHASPNKKGLHLLVTVNP
jgi:hypothetical protein